MTSYKAGANVHLIQARKALEDQENWQIAKLDDIGSGFITLSVNGTTTQFRCDDSTRLREVYTSGRVPVTKDGTPIVIKANHNVLIVPCANEGSSFPLQASVFFSVSYIKDGAAQYSPTDNGAWHLFSIGAITGESAGHTVEGRLAEYAVKQQSSWPVHGNDCRRVGNSSVD